MRHCRTGFRSRSESCFERVAKLVDRCRRMNGNFTLLWHNSNLVEPSSASGIASVVAARRIARCRDRPRASSYS